MDLINCLENSEVGEGKEGGYMVCKKDQKKFKDEQKKDNKKRQQKKRKDGSCRD